MDLQVTKQINIDVSNHKYISLDAKQYDRNLRYILITCYREGELLPINKNTCFASIRYRKPDEYGVFNSCEITQDGKILVELTEQMLAVAGTCYADVVIHKNVELITDIGTTIVNVDDKDLELLKLEDLHNNEIISTMTFIVYVHEAAFDNKEVESSYEYNKLNDLIAKAENTYVNVMNSCNSSKVAAAESEAKAKVSEGKALASEQAAAASQSAASNSQTAAANSASSASGSATAAANSAKAASDSQQAASGSAQAASDSAKAAGNSATAASDSAKAASDSKDVVEQINNSITGSINTLTSSGNVGSFIFMGKITFEELTLLSDSEKAMGYVYAIADDFVTTDNFVEDAGLSYAAGTNVYYVIDGEGNGKWDCLGGATSPTATVNEVKEYLGI